VPFRKCKGFSLGRFDGCRPIELASLEKRAELQLALDAWITRRADNNGASIERCNAMRSLRVLGRDSGRTRTAAQRNRS
jgi:hypothetical protein